MTITDLIAIYECKKAEFGNETYKYLSQIFEEAKELHKKFALQKGLSDTEFGIGRYITRQDAAVIIARAAKIGDDGASADIFDDAAEIADYAEGAVGALTKIGAINGNGDGLFLPNDAVTRAEAVKIVYNVTR